MTLTDSNLRYLLTIHHLAQQSTEVSPLALAQAMGVTKPSVTSILTSLMKQGVIVRRRYGKIYITDRGVLYARYYDELVEKILQHFPLAGEGFTPEECYSAAVAMAVSLPAREIDEKCESLYGEDCREGSCPLRGAERTPPPTVGERFIPHGRVKTLPHKSPIKIPFAKFYCTPPRIVVK